MYILNVLSYFCSYICFVYFISFYKTHKTIICIHNSIDVKNDNNICNRLK